MSDLGFLDIWFCSSWLIGTACVLHLIIRYARKFVRVTVNCWFCNNNSKVPLLSKNEWYCVHCDQFNGFDKDGSYSKEIPEQYNENLNSLSKSCVLNKGITAKSNGLCRICNANQELKVRQLAVYEPFREENYDQEIEWFKQRLEKSYKLCSICEKTVENTLKLKGNLYAKACDQKFYEEKTIEFFVAKKKRVLICGVVFGVLIAMASFWKYLTKVDFLQNELLTDFLSADLLALSRDYDIFVNIFSIACITTFLRMKRPHGRIFGYPLILGILFYGLRDYLPVALKILTIVLFFGYFITSWWKKKATYVKFRKLNEDFKNRFIELDEDTKSVSEKSVCSSSDLFVGNPLCGKFSSLTLGRSSTVAPAKNVPYLFRSTSSIIQPPRLKLDESSKCESPRTSPSTSSGYESVANFSKRSPDSVSEFDSVSQVGVNGRHYSFETRNRFASKVDNAFETSPDKRLCTFGGEPTLVSPYWYSTNRCWVPSEHCYGVSPSLGPQQSPPVPANTIFSTVQIISCSMAFFALGFCFQLFVNKLLS